MYRDALVSGFVSSVWSTSRNQRTIFKPLDRLFFEKKNSSRKLKIKFYFAINQEYNNSIQKYIKGNIQYSNQIIYKIKCGKGKEAYIEAGGLQTIGFLELQGKPYKLKVLNENLD